jgi:Transglycosylase SLT domain
MRARIAIGSLVLLAIMTGPAVSAKQTREEFAQFICKAADTSARNAGVDSNFLVRLLWKESMFDPNAVSPKGAQGIAQFMPGTAEMRGLADPFDPVAAVEASATYLAELKKLFGNLGLAAAAYNAGEERVRRWKAGKGGMPDETQDYVAFITGKEVEAWREDAAAHAIPAVGTGKDITADCTALALRLKSPNGGGIRTAKRRPWGVLLATHFNQRVAIAMFRRLKQRAPRTLTQVDPMIIRKRNLSRGTKAMNMVYAGANTREEAQVMCSALGSAGIPCVVQKTR